MEPYSTLLNRELVLASTRDDYLIVEKGYLTQIMSPLVERIFIDEDWYAERYPDVVAALREKKIKDIPEHFVLCGYYEHRMPYNIAVDEDWYLTQYEDVRTAVIAKIYDSGQRHFEECGYKEGRIPYPNFRLKMRNEDKK